MPPLALSRELVIVGGMIEAERNPGRFGSLPGIDSNASGGPVAVRRGGLEHPRRSPSTPRRSHRQERKIEELGVEMEKLRKLLSHFVNGHRSEKRILTGPDQQLAAV